MYDFNNAPKQTPAEVSPQVTDPISAFGAAMADAGYNPGAIIADGEIHRFDIKKRGDKAGWYWLALDGCPAGKYGDWISQDSIKWSAIRQDEMTPAQIADVARKYEAAKKAREAETAKRNEAARIKAARIFDQAQPAPADHAYLQSKKIQSYDLKLSNTGQIIVPMFDAAGELWSLQFISADGSKKFLSGGAIKGNFYTIPGDDQIFICEGLATGATIHEATDATVIVAFNSGNLTRVAKKVRVKQPGKQITICADNDQWTDGNPGVKAARAAAAEIGARVVIPEFKDLSAKPTDFNDLARLEGPQAVNEQIQASITKPICCILTLAEFQKIEIQERKAFLNPWLKEESINLIFGWRGAGKTWFVLSIFDAVTKGTKFGPWQCLKSVPCLFLDGEMTIGDDQERINALNLTSDRQNPFYIYSDHYANRLGIPRANLANELWRNEMKSILVDRGIKLWAVDNIASLASGLDENQKQDWDPINQWLLDLRYAGITTILLHHETKEGKQRGTSAREDNLDVSIQLKKPPRYTPEDGCKFITNFSKARIANKYLSLIGDTEFQLIQDESGHYAWTFAKTNTSQKKEVLKMLDEGLTQQLISVSLRLSKGYVSKIRQKAIVEGLLTKEGKLTQSGYLYVGNLAEKTGNF